PSVQVSPHTRLAGERLQPTRPSLRKTNCLGNQAAVVTPFYNGLSYALFCELLQAGFLPLVNGFCFFLRAPCCFGHNYPVLASLCRPANFSSCLDL
ncbi:MAG: hypothetical protein QMD09_14805, partial [Desulfatibacillaceae bacterium]|nr:hypothetical protein [Desulfatibacillaceae bacterium]